MVRFKFSFRQLFVLVFLSIPLCSCKGERSSVYQWTLQSSATETSVDFQELLVFAENVSVMSGGRLLIAPHPAGKLVGGPDIFRAVSERRVEMGNGWPNWWSGQHPAWAILNAGPFDFMNIDASMMFFFEGGGTAIANELSLSQGIMWRPAWWPGMEFGLLSAKPIYGLADLEGKKVRIGPGLPSEVLAAASGAFTIPLVPEEIKASLVSGDLDAVEWTTPSGVLDLGLQSIASHAIVPAIWQPSVLSDFLINQEAYVQLPKDLQAILETAIRSYTLTTTLKSKKADFEAFVQLKERGVVFSTWSKDDLEIWEIQSSDILERYRRKDEHSKRLIDKKRAFKKAYDEYYKWFGAYD